MRLAALGFRSHETNPLNRLPGTVQTVDGSEVFRVRN